ncbi:unnamed protein product [Protopolystoma xenopodis]|uniref:Uncharacterized protein n=1 Tax=Protopolystoma xenopodis TaxID=117903 RepID=A0A448XQ57_9PLAT|nr:unnamed protein product [Protopolystoma xenopodis]
MSMAVLRIANESRLTKAVVLVSCCYMKKMLVPSTQSSYNLDTSASLSDAFNFPQCQLFKDLSVKPVC